MVVDERSLVFKIRMREIDKARKSLWNPLENRQNIECLNLDLDAVRQILVGISISFFCVGLIALKAFYIPEKWSSHYNFSICAHTLWFWFLIQSTALSTLASVWLCFLTYLVFQSSQIFQFQCCIKRNLLKKFVSHLIAPLVHLHLFSEQLSTCSSVSDSATKFNIWYFFWETLNFFKTLPIFKTFIF